MTKANTHKRIKLLAIFATLTAALAAIAYFSYSFTRCIEESQNEIGHSRLMQSAQRNVDFMKQIVNSKVAYMAAVALTLSTQEDLASTETMVLLKEVSDNGGFQRMAINFADGTSHTSDGFVVDISDMGYFDNVKSGTAYISDMLFAKLDGEPCIAIGSPIIKDGKPYAIVRGVINTKDLGTLVNIDAFDEDGRFNLIDGDGDYLATSDNNSSQLTGSNYFDIIDTMKLDAGYSKEKIAADFKDGISGFAGYALNGVSYSAQYLPVGINDWMLMVVVPKSVIEKNSVFIQENVISLTVKIGIVLAIVLGSVALGAMKSRKEVEKINSELLINEKRYRFILERSDNVIFEYTLESGAIEYSEKISELLGKTPTSTGLPHSIISNGTIHPDDASQLISIFTSVKNGNPSAKGELRILAGNGKYIWCSIIVVTVFDEKNHPIKALGVIENISSQKESELRYKDAQMYKSALESEKVLIYEVNLSQDCYISGYEGLLQGLDHAEKLHFTEAQKLLATQHIYNEDVVDFLKQNNPKTLIAAYISGLTDLEYDFRTFARETKQVLWHRRKYKLFTDPVNNEICGIVSLTDVTQQKQKEIDLLDKVQKDELTGLLNKIATENRIKDFLGGNETHAGKHALLIIDVDNFKTVNDKMGHLYGDIVLAKLADKLKPLFRINDIVGRIGGDEFFVFMKNVATVELVESKAKEICERFDNTYYENNVTCHISASVGIALCPLHGASFEELYQNADTALYSAKSRGKNCYGIYDGSQFVGYESNRTKIDTIDSLPQKSFRENRVEYVFKILYGSENPIWAVRSVLELMADYSGFSRGYIFEFSEDGKSMSNTFEWCDKNIEPQIDNLQSLPTEVAANAINAFEKSGMYILKNLNNSSESERNLLYPQGIKAMFQFGIYDEGRLVGIIGFDDCVQERTPTAVEIDEISTICNVLATFIVKQRAVGRVQSNYLALLAVMNNLDSFAYVVERESFKILFCNRHTMGLNPAARIGKPCYSSFRDHDSHCQDCPVLDLMDSSIERSTRLLYNKKYDFHTRCTASRINWTTGEEAFLLNCIKVDADGLAIE